MPGPTPLVVELSNRFRAQLLARERAAATAMVRYYGETWRRLQADIAALRDQIEAMRQRGEDVSQGRIWRLERMQAIQRQVETEMARFAEFADGQITDGMREAIMAGERNARALLEGMYPPGSITARFDRMARGAVEQLAGFLQNGMPLENLLRQALGDAADDFAKALVRGLAMGWNPRRLARELRDRFGMGLNRALSISRTEMLRAWRTATLNSYRASGLVKEWERCAAHDRRTCLACILLDGKRYSLDEDMDDHVNGRCCLLPVTKGYRELGIDVPEPDFSREMGRDWFLRQSDEVQRLMMGVGRWQAWKDGRFELDDIPHKVTDPIWGNSWVPRALYDLLGEDAPVGSYAGWLARQN